MMFLMVLLLYSCSSSICMMASKIPPEAKDINGAIENPENINFSSHYLNSVQHKLDSVISVLSTVDTSIKVLQEKAHTWAIFRHHIDSWNDQMKSLEHKLDLIKRTQDENQAFGNKLTSLEFTLNHILSKVVYLSDNSCCNDNQKAQAEAIAATNFRLSTVNDRYAEIHHLLVGDKKLRNEIGTRLSNILRYVQNIENEKCRPVLRGGNGGGPFTNKMAKLMHPVGGFCNGSHRHDTTNMELSMKAIEQKINQFTHNLSQKDLKQVTSAAKKNMKSLEDILNVVKILDERTLQVHDAGKEYDTRLTSFCQSVSSELSTFTESSDLLLKRIERVVMDVQAKIDYITKIEEHKNITTRIADQNGTRVEAESEQDEDDDETNDDVDEHKIAKNPTIVNETYNGNGDSEESEEEVSFVQPTKIACHELLDRIDGIYKLSSPELNDAGRDFNERYCAFPTDGTAWTVIQNRGPYAVQENFNRSWAEYRDGFGRLDKDFWFGNEFIHQMVYREDYELRFEMEDFDGVNVWAEYSIFRVDSEKYNYNLLIGGYRGAVPDAMHYHNELDFSTYDRRNDKSIDACCACATGYASGWWFDNCSEANLNGIFHETPLGHNYVGIVWEHWRGDYSLKKTKMMIRPKNWINEGSTEILTESAEDP